MTEPNISPLVLLRRKLREKQLDYYLVGSSDPHNNESPPEHWRYLAHVSGFTGSLGYLLVSQGFAGLWVDSRYHIQAERECSQQIQVFRIGKPGVPALHEYWQQCLGGEGPRLGFDGSCFSRGSLGKLLTASADSSSAVDGESLLTDELWPLAPPRPDAAATRQKTPRGARPARPESPVIDYPLEYCGQSRKEKVLLLRRLMAEQAYDYYPVPLLDNIAWLLNVRASDIAYNPVAISYLLLGAESLYWYINEQRLAAELRGELRRDLPELEIRPYEQFYEDCRRLARQTPSRFLLSERCNMLLFSSVLGPVTPRAASGRDIITDLKAIKNPTEQQQLREVMAIDGAALTAFHCRLRPQPGGAQELEQAKQDAEQLDEYQLGLRLIEQRRRSAGVRGKGESFAPIVGFGPNSALPHYSAAPPGRFGGSSPIRCSGGWMLIDSGGQYLGGTTDMTRCFSLERDFAAPRFSSAECAEADPEPSEELRRIYTLVLRGHLQLQNARFPNSAGGARGTLGIQLDALARAPLWSAGLDFQHGTGHGVGSFLNVHEGPASLSPSPLNEPLKAGMLLSNEPGYYREGAFGIRIENLLLVQEDPQDPDWLYFEPVTTFPYERELICLEQLSAREILWIDQYHAYSLEHILASGKLESREEQWLRWRCAPLAGSRT